MTRLVQGAGCERADECVLDPACELYQDCKLVCGDDDGTLEGEHSFFIVIIFTFIIVVMLQLPHHHRTCQDCAR